MRTASENKLMNGRYTRWVEPDPERFKIWRSAWEMLLEDKLTLDEICEALHTRGYRYRSGRPFVEVKANGKRKINKSTISRIFHNWFYAGWVVSDKADIPPKTVRGNWEPIVTTEEFEHGLEILSRRSINRFARRKHQYLLKGLVYIQLSAQEPAVRMTCSTCNTRSNINLSCEGIEQQVAMELRDIQVDPKTLPLIQAAYTQEIAEKLGHLRPGERIELEMSLKNIDEEEGRMARLFAAGKISDQIWDGLWREWQDRRTKLRLALETLGQQRQVHINHLDTALNIIAKVGFLYNGLEYSDQQELLRQMVERVVVNKDGKLIRMELLPPFAYLREITRKVRGGGRLLVGEKKNASKLGSAGKSSSYVPSGVPGGIRTPDLLLRRQMLYPLSHRHILEVILA